MLPLGLGWLKAYLFRLDSLSTSIGSLGGGLDNIITCFQRQNQTLRHSPWRIRSFQDHIHTLHITHLLLSGTHPDTPHDAPATVRDTSSTNDCILQGTSDSILQGTSDLPPPPSKILWYADATKVGFFSRSLRKTSFQQKPSVPHASAVRTMDLSMDLSISIPVFMPNMLQGGTPSGIQNRNWHVLRRPVSCLQNWKNFGKKSWRFWGLAMSLSLCNCVTVGSLGNWTRNCDNISLTFWNDQFEQRFWGKTMSVLKEVWSFWSYEGRQSCTIDRFSGFFRVFVHITFFVRIISLNSWRAIQQFWKYFCIGGIYGTLCCISRFVGDVFSLRVSQFPLNFNFTAISSVIPPSDIGLGTTPTGRR